MLEFKLHHVSKRGHMIFISTHENEKCVSYHRALNPYTLRENADNT